MAVTIATSGSRRTNQFYEVTNVEGQDAVLLIGDKDNILVPTDYLGTNPIYSNAEVTFKVYEGSVETTNTWTLVTYVTNQVNGSLNQSTKTYTVTNLTADIGSVTIRASKPGFDDIYREIKVYRVKNGANGSFTYIAFADKVDGTGFTTTYSNDKEYFAIIYSTVALVPLTSNNFTGLWRPLYNYSNTCDYNNVSYIPTTESQWSANGMAQGYLGPAAYHYKGNYNRIYFAMLDYHRDSAGTLRTDHVNETKIGYYDIDNKYFSTLTSISHAYPISTDLHDVPTIIVSDDGHIIVVKEQLRSPGSHNSPLEIWRSDSIEDISSFTLITTISTVNPFDIGYSYPTLILGPNIGDVYIFARYQDSSNDHSFLRGLKSDDNGITWTSFNGVLGSSTLIADCANIVAGPTDWYFYFKIANGKRINGFNILGVLNEGNTGTSPDGTPAASRNKMLVYFRSTDGVNWENIQSYKNIGSGEFTKNILIAGNITPSDLTSYCLVVSHNTTAHLSSSPYQVWIDDNGMPYIFDRTYNRYHSTENPDYSVKDDIVTDDVIRYYDISTNTWLSSSYKEFFRDPYDTDSGKTYYSLLPSRLGAIVYSNGIIDVIGRRVIRKNDFYKLDLTPISTGSGIISGGIYKIVTTTTNHFGEGIVAGDYIYIYNTSLVDSSNTVLPLEIEPLIIRSYDKGITWTELKPSLQDFKEDKYASVNPSITVIPNSQDSGVAGVFIGVPKKLNGVNAYDHTEYYFLWDKIKT